MWLYPKIVAHRGGGSLAPENTMAALRCGLAHGFHAVEFDVMLSRDGVAVVLHDATLGRTVRAAGQVSACTARQLSSFDAGTYFGAQYAQERVPLFAQFLDFCTSSQIWMNIEIKPAPGFERATGRVVAEAARAHFAADIEDVERAHLLPLLSSFSTAALSAAFDAAPELARGWLVDELKPDWQARARALGVVAMHVNHQKLSRMQADTVKRAGFGLFCYTVNDPQRAREILAWGVDGFCTDRIDLIGASFV